jgi:hypothetical protein
VVWAACLAGLPGVLHAESGTRHTVYVDHAGPQSRLEWAVGGMHGTAAPGDVISTTVGDWEVTLEFDAIRCAVYCAYRRVRESGGRGASVDLLLLPVTTLRFYADLHSRPVSATVDPAGRGEPRAERLVSICYRQECSGGRRLPMPALVRHGSSPAPASLTLQALPIAGANPALPAAAPLLI